MDGQRPIATGSLIAVFLSQTGGEPQNQLRPLELVEPFGGPLVDVALLGTDDSGGAIGAS